MTQNFIDPFDDLGALKKIIMNCTPKSDYFTENGAMKSSAGPVLPLCQRSGSGKTKTMIEIGRCLFPMVYISFRGALKTAHPSEVENMFGELGHSASDNDCQRFSSPASLSFWII